VAELWTLEDLQAFTKIPMRTLKFYIATKEIPSIKIGRHRRFDPDEIKRWLKKKVT
jgi:excisionase family DNA binding protein